MLFWTVFVLPTLLAIMYNGLIAADRYVSETSFVVRRANSVTMDGATDFLKTFGVVVSNDDIYAVQEFIQSRSMARQLERQLPLRSYYRRPEADILTGYWRSGRWDTEEGFYRYFRDQIDLTKNIETGITTVKVSSYRPVDSFKIATHILRLAENKVNELNARQRRNSVDFAQARFDEAERKLVNAEAALSRFRKDSRHLDPVEQATATIERTTALEQMLAQTRASLQTAEARAPSSPLIPALRERVAALSAEIAVSQSQTTGDKGESLATSLGDFDQLMVRRALAEKAFEAAQRDLSNALAEVRTQSIYLQPVANPNLVDKSTEPRRWRGIMTVAILSFWAFLILYLLVSGSRDHLNIN